MSGLGVNPEDHFSGGWAVSAPWLHKPIMRKLGYLDSGKTNWPVQP